MKFATKAKDVTNTEKMSPKRFEIFALALLAEKLALDPKALRPLAKNEYFGIGFIPSVIGKRLDAFGLDNLKFTYHSIIALSVMVNNNPGRAIAALIDLLTEYYNPETVTVVTVKMLVDMYPHGYYNEETFIDYVDNYIKPHKVKWSEIY